MSTSTVTSEQALQIYQNTFGSEEQSAEPYVSTAYIQIGSEVRPVWVCSADGNYGNHIMIDMVTGEQITV